MIPPIHETVTPEFLASLPDDERKHWEQAVENSRRRPLLIAEALNAGNWDGALVMSDSQERGPILARAGRELEGAALREVIEDWWSTTEAWGGDPELRDGVMDAIHKAALDGPVIVPSDDPGRLQKAPEGRFEVYRGNLGETPQGGSWTLDREVAERFARMASGPRGQIVLGMSGPGPGSIWRGWVEADDVLGFFDDRHEYEIVTDHVYGIEKIAELVNVERDPFGIGASTVEEAS
jgi:hypothetical protein